MSTELVCLIITICIVYIWDYVRFPNEVIGLVFGVEPNKIQLKKPFGCSLCITFWTTLFVLLLFNYKMCFLSIGYAFITKYILYTIETIDLFLSKMIEIVQRLLSKI